MLLIGSVLLTGCNAKEGSKVMTNLPPVDWQRLEFTCSHEADRLPKPDQQADEWYVRANELYRYGIKRDDESALKQSVELLMKASELGHVKAMNNLSKSYLDGDGIAQSDAKAVAWIEELIKRNIGMGYYQMGVFLQQGIGVKQDRKAALTYFRKAADLGNAQGQVVSGKKISEAVAQSSAEEKERGFAISRAMLQIMLLLECWLFLRLKLVCLNCFCLFSLCFNFNRRWEQMNADERR